MKNKDRNEKILKIVCELLEKMNVGIENVVVEDMVTETEGEENQVLVAVTASAVAERSNAAGLIGLRGRNLAMIQLILSLLVKNKLGEWVKIVLDVNNYREEQRGRLEKMVTSLANKVLETGKEVALANMSSYERRICHMVAGGIEGVVTESEGEEGERHVIIKPRA